MKRFLLLLSPFLFFNSFGQLPAKQSSGFQRNSYTGVTNSLTYFGSSSNPTDNSDFSASTATITPPASMIAGDIVYVCASVKSSTQNPSITTTGGQTWTSLSVQQLSGVGSIRSFYCVFNGTWTTSPIVSFGTSIAPIAVMHVFRPQYPNSIVDLNVDIVQTSHSAATTITAPEIQTAAENTITLVAFSSGDDNSWGSISGTGWNVLGNAQYRNTNSTDASLAFAYKVQGSGLTGTVSLTQTANGPDAAGTQMFSLRVRVPIESNVTLGNHELLLAIGDSNASGAAESIPTVSLLTLYLWDGTIPQEITTQDVDNDPDVGDHYGSLYQQYATDYKANTARRTVLINKALGGSTVVSGWNDTGSSNDLWDLAKLGAQQARDFFGISRVSKGIIHLCINDIRGVSTITDINNAIDDLLDRWAAAFPGVPLYWFMPGRGDTFIYNDRHHDVLSHLVDEAESRDFLYIVGQGLPFYGAGYMQGDNLHYNTAGVNIIGSINARFEGNSSISNEWSRSVVSSTFDNLSDSRKTLLKNVVEGLYNRNNFFTLEHLSIFQNTTLGNALTDLSYLGTSYGVLSPTYTANSDIRTNGTSNYIQTTFNPATCDRASQNDMFFGVYVSEVNTSGACTIFGVSDGIGFQLRQTASGLEYRVNRTSFRAVNGVFLEANHWYFIARNGTTQYLLRDGTVIDSEVAASDGLPNLYVTLGCLNSSGSAASYGDFKFKFDVGGKYSDFDMANFLTDMSALSGW